MRDHLKRLPAFEDAEAEERALDLVAEHDDLQEALWFLLHWPEPRRAVRLVLASAKPLNGDCYVLQPRLPSAPRLVQHGWPPELRARGCV